MFTYKSAFKTYLPELDGLRAVAVLSVLLYHMDIFPFLKGGFSGVDIFFVISGYVISRSIYTKSESSIPKYLGMFYKRRILRIIPALFFCLLITHLLAILFIPFSWKNELIHQTALSTFFGYSNFTLVFQNDGYFSPHAEYNPFLHTWSLGVEEQFYLLFPVIFFLWLRFKESKTAFKLVSWIILPVLFLISLLFSIYVSRTNHDNAYYLLHSRFWELASGALLFQIQTSISRIKLSQWIIRFLYYFGFLLLLIGIIRSDAWSFPYPWALLPVSGTLIIILVTTEFFSENQLNFYILNNPVMIYLGRISYSLYLWHWPVIVLFRWTIGYHTLPIKLISLIVMGAFAVFSYHAIEIPIRQNQYLRKQVNWKILVSGLSVLFIGFLVAQFMFAKRHTLSLSKTKVLVEWNSGKYSCDELKEPVYKDPSLQSRKLFVMGDSHTAAYRTMLNILSSKLGVKVYEYEEGGCSVANLLEPMKRKNWSHFENSLQEINNLAQAGDIVFLASLRMPELSNRFESVNITEVLKNYFSTDAEKERELALNEADTIIWKLEKLGLIVLIDAPKPVLLIPPYRCSDWFNRNNPIASPGYKISTSLLKDIRKPILKSLDHLQSIHPNLQIWDPFPVLCTESEFSAYDKTGLPVYYDGDHLSGHGNRLLEPSFERIILEIWNIEPMKNQELVVN